VADWLAESLTLMVNAPACIAVSGVSEIVTVLVSPLLSVKF
jgi:hypothetical protein